MAGDRPGGSADADEQIHEPAGTASSRRPWYRRPRRVILIVVLVVFAGGVGVFAVLWANRGPEEVSTQDAVERYREEEGGGTETAGFLQPATGVYTYEGSGTERLSLLGTNQEWGPTIPATVTRETDGCWSFRIDFSTNHWQVKKYCPSGDQLLDLGGPLHQSFDLVAAHVGDTTEFTCDPPIQVIRVNAEPGESWDASCDGGSEGRGTQVTAAGTNTFVGIEQIEIGGEEVASLHYREYRELSGDQTGTEDTHEWFDVADGLLLRSTHDTRVASPSPIGDIIYTEEGEFRLTSRTPHS
ncbi:MAG: hypothetical protein R3A49_03570 [Acidimicrobiia bacterium]